MHLSVDDKKVGAAHAETRLGALDETRTTDFKDSRNTSLV